MAAFAPDVIYAAGGSSVGPLLQATRTVPIVFAMVPDPVGSGFVASLARPGGNATGFMQFEYSLTGKWVELLKQVAPGVTRAAVLWDPTAGQQPVLSDTTVEAFADLGYAVLDPSPGSAFVVLDNNWLV